MQDDESVVPIDAKEVEAPPKKNRLQSSGRTDSSPPPTTPPATEGLPLGTSPPHESKVRQIRKRVKDLSWKEAHRRRSDEGSAGEVDPQDDGPEAGDAASEGKAEDDDSSKSVSAKSDSDKEEVERAGISKVATAEVTAGSPARVSTPPLSPPHVPSTSLPEPATAVEDKLPENDSALTTAARLSPDPESCQGKRRRDDGDQNPRETKRISPPPDKEKDEPKPKPVKLVSHNSQTVTGPSQLAVDQRVY
jgi:Ran-binding protein 3